MVAQPDRQRQWPEPVQVRQQIVTAIIVDGGFYRRRARTLFGEKEPADRADELLTYCRRHMREARASLHRIYYYDCPRRKRLSSIH